MSQAQIDGLSAVRRAAHEQTLLTEKTFMLLRMLGLVELIAGADEAMDGQRLAGSLRLTVLGALTLRALQQGIPAESGATVFPAASDVYALEASAAMALGRVSSDRREEALAIELAFYAGHAAYPSTLTSVMVANEPALAKNWKAGWRQREYEKRPLTREDLEGKLREFAKSAQRGCGHFFELYEQTFTDLADAWLPELRDGEREVAMALLLESECYRPNPAGRWVHDVEENDVCFVPNAKAAV